MEETKMIDCTLVSVTQRKAELNTRENRAKNYSAAMRKKKENFNELANGLIWGVFLTVMLCIGFIF